MELKIPIEIVFDDVNSVIDELGKLQTYKLGAGDDMTLVDVDDVADVLTRHVMAREAKEPCGTKEGWIPCSERLPEEDEDVLVCSEEGDIDIACWMPEQWTDEPHIEWWSGEYRVYAVAWMPLPEAYGGEIDES